MSTSSPSSSPDPSFFARLALAFQLFFRVLLHAAFAGQAKQLTQGAPEPQPEAKPQPQPESKLRAAPTDSALQLLGLLQREGRLIDFLMEDMGSYADAEIGAAARVVHDQCSKALQAHVTIERIRSEAEGARITLPAGFRADEVRPVGNVTGEPPFTGALTHAGWRAQRIELPQLSEGHDVAVLAPAEVEL